MLDEDQDLRDRTRQRGRCYRQGVIRFACLSLMAGAGCGLDAPVPLHETTVETIRGKDSAGATIELEKRGNDLTQARVIDMVLGTGEAKIISDKDGHVEFTIDFPAGATITYVGAVQESGTSSSHAIAGTWTQHSAGIFGEDTGTWGAATDPS